MSKDRTLSTIEAGARLDLTENQIRARVNNGTLTAWKENGCWQITVESIEKLEDRMFFREQAGKPRTKKKPST